jgi:hypothetical protein
MDEEQLARAIRSDMRRRDAAPLLAAIWVILGLSFVFGVIGILGWLAKVLQHHPMTH